MAGWPGFAILKCESFQPIPRVLITIKGLIPMRHDRKWTECFRWIDFLGFGALAGDLVIRDTGMHVVCRPSFGNMCRKMLLGGGLLLAVILVGYDILLGNTNLWVDGQLANLNDESVQQTWRAILFLGAGAALGIWLNLGYLLRHPQLLIERSAQRVRFCEGLFRREIGRLTRDDVAEVVVKEVHYPFDRHNSIPHWQYSLLVRLRGDEEQELRIYRSRKPDRVLAMADLLEKVWQINVVRLPDEKNSRLAS